MKPETKFKSWFLSRWENAGGWGGRYEPSMGSDIGYADTQLLIRQLVPFEFKMATIGINDKLYSDTIRPSQIGWHERLNRFGQCTFFLWGIKVERGYRVYQSETGAGGLDVMGWEGGIPLYRLKQVDDRLMARDVYSYSLERIERWKPRIHGLSASLVP